MATWIHRQGIQNCHFLFDEIENVSDEDVSIAAGFPRDKLICLDATNDEQK